MKSGHERILAAGMVTLLLATVVLADQIIPTATASGTVTVLADYEGPRDFLTLDGAVYAEIVSDDGGYGYGYGYGATLGRLQMELATPGYGYGYGGAAAQFVATFEDVPDGTYTVRVFLDLQPDTHAGALEPIAIDTVTVLHSATRHLVVAEGAASVAGTVLTAASALAPGVPVSLHDAFGDSYAAVSDASGAFAITGIPTALQGTRPFMLLAHGLNGTAVLPVDLAAGPNGPYTLTLSGNFTPPAGIPSLVVNDGAAYVPALDVTLTLTRPDATFTHYCVAVDLPGCAPTTPFPGAGQNATVPFTLPAGDGHRALFLTMLHAPSGLNATGAAFVIVDTQAPLLHVELLGQPTVVHGPQVAVLATASDLGGIASMRVAATAAGLDAAADQPYVAHFLFNLTPVPAGEAEVRSVHVRVTDVVGRATDASASVLLDMRAPGNVTLLGPGPRVATQLVNLTVAAENAVLMALANENDSFPALTPLTSNVAWLLSPGEGLKTVRLLVEDANGDRAQATLNLVLDQSAPTGTLRILDGAPITAAANVTLAIDALERGPAGGALATMAFSNDGGATFSAPEPFAPAKAWTLAPGDGLKAVHARVTDDAGNAAILSANVTLDTTPPSADFALNGTSLEPGYTRVRNVTVRILNATGGPAAVGVGVDGGPTTFTAYAGTLRVELPDVEGLHFVRVALRDEAGNVRDLGQRDIVLDRVAPHASVLINGGALATATTSVVLDVAASDAWGVSRMALSNSSGALPGTPALPFAPGAYPWELLPVGVGADVERTVFLRVADPAGNVRTVNDTIRLDRAAPFGSFLVSGLGPTNLTRSAQVNVTLVGLGGSPTHVAIAEDAPPTTGFTPIVGSTLPFTLAGPDGVRTVHVALMDALGNVRQLGGKPILLDRVAPATTSDAPAGFIRSTTTIAFHATDATSGVDATYARLDGGALQTGSSLTVNPAVLADGAHSLAYWSTDRAGNVETTQLAQLLVDKRAPNVTVTVNRNVRVTPFQAVLVEYSVEDNRTATPLVSGVASIVARVDDGAPIVLNATVGSFDAPLDALGSHVITVTATDHAGNARTVTQRITRSAFPASPNLPPFVSPTNATTPGDNATPPPEDTPGKVRRETVVTRDRPAVVDVRAPGVPIHSIVLRSGTSQAVRVRLDVRVTQTAQDLGLGDRPGVGGGRGGTLTIPTADGSGTLTVPMPPGRAIMVLDITVINEETGQRLDVEDAGITFALSRADLLAAGLHPRQVVLTHYDGAAWERLETSIVTENGDEIVFTATTTSFSPFAIVADRDAPTATFTFANGVLRGVIVDDLTGLDARSVTLLVDGEPVDASRLQLVAGVLTLRLDDLAPGPHTVRVTLADRAGNTGTTDADFTVAGAVVAPPTTPTQVITTPEEPIERTSVPDDGAGGFGLSPLVVLLVLALVGLAVVAGAVLLRRRG